MSRISYSNPRGTLRELILDGLERWGESAEDVERIVISSPDDRKRDAVETQYASLDELDAFEGATSYGTEEFPNFHVWTEERVYYKNTYDGAEGVRSVPRSPTLEDPDPLSRPNAGDEG